MDNATTLQEKDRMDAMDDQVFASPRMECDHTIELFDQHGKIRGSWKEENSPHGIRYSCRSCGKFYGYQGYQPDKTSHEARYQACLERQRRLNCPRCGDGPFMG